MGLTVSSSDENINPFFDCCNNCIKYVLNGCKSECACSKCFTCKIEAINHTTPQEIITPNSDDSD